MRETGHCKQKSLVKVPKELLQLQQKVCIGVDIFFINCHIFSMMYRTKICFTRVTHLINHKVSEVWAAMHKIYQMYMLCGFHIVEIAGDREIAWIADQVAPLPTTPILNLAAASEHVGLVERNIHSLKEKTRLIHYSLPFEHILMLVHMVLYTMQFMNSFTHKRGLKHYPPSAIMTGAQLHMSQLQLKFGSYCQVAKDVTPHNSLAARTCAAISLQTSGNLSEGQRFLALDTGKLFVRNRWKELPMPLAVIDQVNMLDRAKYSLLVFLDCLGQANVNYTPTVGETDDGDDDESVVNDLYSPVLPASSELAGVSLVKEGSADMIPGVDLPAVVDVVSEPTGVDTGGPQSDPPQINALLDEAVFDMALDDGLETYKLNEPIDEPKVASPKAGMVACNACNRKQPQKYVSSMQGNKYQIESAQIITSLKTIDASMALAKMSVNLMNKGIHQRADIVGMVMAQVLLKAALKKWCKEAEESVGKEMKQLHW